MKVVFTGGGTGGHFYPLIAVAEELNHIIDTEAIAESDLYYFGTEPYDEEALFTQRMEFCEIPAGKNRLYFSFSNFFDIFITLRGIIKAIFTLYVIYPDVVFSKGGYVAFPTVVAARIMRIPVVMHESDSAPGRVNQMTGKFAKYIALSWHEAAEYFPKDKIAVTGQPVRHAIAHTTEHGSHEYLHLEEETPTLFILGGSQGAVMMNDAILDALPELIENYQIIHQVGEKNFEEVEIRTQSILTDNPKASRYKIFPFLKPLAMSMAAGAADLVISRAGSTIFEIAAWGVPAILVPFSESNNDHSRKNAFNYARIGAAVVIEEQNFKKHVLLSEIERLFNNKELYQTMVDNAKNFYDPDAAKQIARAISNIALEHEAQ